MKIHTAVCWIAAALLPASLVAQEQTQTPPPKGQTQTPQARGDIAPFGPLKIAGAVVESGPVSAPIAITPDAGIGEPDALAVQLPQQKVKHDPIPHPEFIPNPENEAPSSDDVSREAQTLMQDWEAIGPNGLTPPDPDVAAGYDYILEATNDDFAVYDRCGEELYRVDANTYYGISSADFLIFDPKVAFDPWGGRWLMLWHATDRTNQQSQLILSITEGSTPFGLSGSNAYFYRFNVVQDAGTSNAAWADYFDLGYSNTTVAASGNMFRFSGGFRWARHIVWDKARIYNRLSAGFLSYSNLTNQDGSTSSTPRNPKQQVRWSESGENVDATFINSRGGGGDKITLWKLKNAFNGGTRSLTRVDIDVGNYTAPSDAVQPDGRRLDTINCRLMPAVITQDNLGSNGIELFTSLTTGFTGGVTRARLFKFNPVNNTLEFETNFGATGWWYWFASPAADFSGSACWVFSRTGQATGREAEARYVDYDQGTFSNSSSQLRDGSGTFGGTRWGDYLGGQMDWGDYSANFTTPGRPSKFWLVGMLATPGSWRTQIGATSVFGQGNVNTVTPTTTFTVRGLAGSVPLAGRTYTLTNTGQVGTAYEVDNLPSWLDASNEGGQLFPGTRTVRLTVNSSANSLRPGTYSASVIFRDCFNGGNSFTRRVTLSVYDLTETCGSGINPRGSLEYVSGLPRIGTSLTFAINNVCNSQTRLFTTPILFFSLRSTRIPLPGFGMCGPVGEFLADPSPGAWLDLLVPGSPWNGSPVNINFSIPNDRGLVGLRLHGQGITQDRFPSTRVPFGLTCGTTFVIGS